MEAQLAESACAILIGSELLNGKVQEANLIELARTLRALGIRLERALVVPDELDTIETEVRAARARFDLVFTSGGVGPTHDDVTIEAVARAFGVRVVSDAGMQAMLRDAYGERCTEGHLRMALIPEGAELAATKEVPWPTVVMDNVWVLPGVPEIFRMKLSVVRERLKGPRSFVSRAVFTLLEEAELKPLLDLVVGRHTEVEIGSYPKWFDPTFKTKVTFDAREPALVDAALQEFLRLLPVGEPQRVE